MKGWYFITQLYGDRQIRGNSSNWRNLKCAFTETTCDKCKKAHGKIFPPYIIFVKLHVFCLCRAVPMRTKTVGTVTKEGINGVDTFLKYTGKLPSNYITKNEARQNKWKQNKGNLNEVLPGISIGGDVYFNNDGKLPEKNRTCLV